VREVSVLPILIALAAAGQQPRDVDLILNTERLGRTKKFEQPRPAARPLAPGELARYSDLPNIAVTYYDVAGSNLDAIHRSLAKLGPRDPETRRILPTTSRWTVGVKVYSMTNGRRCTVLGATLDFRGIATMPRLAADKERPAPVAAAWATYLAQLESRQAEHLRFAYERLGEVERAILDSRCDKAEAAADAVLARLHEQQQRAFAQQTRDQPRLEPPAE
jgi:predicted secreted Zn-dependent protease